MNHAEFIEKNIKQVLIKEGYSIPIAQGGANFGVDHYRRCSQASAKGKMFDDCLRLAKAWAIKNTTSADKSAAKRVRTRKPSEKSPTLF
ncbi:hypothetical protein F3J34_15425 [Klebsiella sp. Ap-873]|nr:hypothetical protein [Klebsiella sp. Ap-873]